MKEHILLTRGTCGVHTDSRPCFTHMLGTAGHNTAQYHELNNGITSAVVPPLKNCGEGKSLSSEEKFGPPKRSRARRADSPTQIRIRNGCND